MSNEGQVLIITSIIALLIAYANCTYFRIMRNEWTTGKKIVAGVACGTLYCVTFVVCIKFIPEDESLAAHMPHLLVACVAIFFLPLMIIQILRNPKRAKNRNTG